MKKLLIMCLLAGAASANPFPVFVEYAQSMQHASETYIFQIQPLSELVGGNELKHELTIGRQPNENFQYGVCLGYVPAQSQYDTAFKVKLSTANPNGLDFFISTKAGIGIQTGENSKNTSTNISKADYITSHNLERFKVPSTITFTENPKLLEAMAQIGTSYKITKDLKLFGAIEAGHKYWEVSYKIKGKENITNRMMETQRLVNLSFGLNYLF